MNDIADAAAEIWSKFLRTERPAPDQNFFEAGGDSVMAMVLTFALGERFGIELLPEAIFDAPTFGALCALIEERLALPVG
ncbi:MAG TPA: acyl carrier protein [Caulobacter sp.]|nr:acyl carrier protein [Caulobacter sp.]